MIWPREGRWKDFSTHCNYHQGGDLIALIAEMETGGRMMDAWYWACDFVGDDPHDHGVYRRGERDEDWDDRPARSERDPVEEERLRAAHAAEAAADAKRAESHRNIARRIFFEESSPLTGRDPASLYLMSRGIDVLAFERGPPRALRFCPECLCDGVKMPALVAHVAIEGKGMVAVHRTFLEFGGGMWRKAFKGRRDENDRPIPAKRVLGNTSGGSVRLQRGASGKPLKDAPKGEWVAVSEGLENGLTLALACPEYRVLAALSVSGIGSIVLPPQIGGVMIVADNDKPGADGSSPVDHAMDRLVERGIEPALIKTERGFKDINDMLLGARA